MRPLASQGCHSHGIRRRWAHLEDGPRWGGLGEKLRGSLRGGEARVERGWGAPSHSPTNVISRSWFPAPKVFAEPRYLLLAPRDPPRILPCARSRTELQARTAGPLVLQRAGFPTALSAQGGSKWLRAAVRLHGCLRVQTKSKGFRFRGLGEPERKSWDYSPLIGRWRTLGPYVRGSFVSGDETSHSHCS